MFFFFYLSWIFLQCDRQPGDLGSCYDCQFRWAPLSLLFLTCLILVVCQGPWANLHWRDYVRYEVSAPGEAPITPLPTVFGFGVLFFGHLFLWVLKLVFLTSYGIYWILGGKCSDFILMTL